MDRNNKIDSLIQNRNSQKTVGELTDEKCIPNEENQRERAGFVGMIEEMEEMVACSRSASGSAALEIFSGVESVGNTVDADDGAQGRQGFAYKGPITVHRGDKRPTIVQKRRNKGAVTMAYSVYKTF